jgi:chromosomal replication initiation ATPase DnaA
MYLAKHVGGWSMVKIGRFYNGRHHTTVLHAIQKVQRLRCEDESVDALIEVLTAALREDVRMKASQDNAVTWRAELVETVAARVLDRLAELQADVGWSRGAS